MISFRLERPPVADTVGVSVLRLAPTAAGAAGVRRDLRAQRLLAIACTRAPNTEIRLKSSARSSSTVVVAARPFALPLQLWRWTTRNPAVALLCMALLLTGITSFFVVGAKWKLADSQCETQLLESGRSFAESIRILRSLTLTFPEIPVYRVFLVLAHKDQAAPLKRIDHP